MSFMSYSGSCKNEFDVSSWWCSRKSAISIMIVIPVAADFLFSGSERGLASAIGTLLYLWTILKFRCDFSFSEKAFLCLCAGVSVCAQVISGSFFAWALILILPIIMLYMGDGSAEKQPDRVTWWGYWYRNYEVVLQILLALLVGIILYAAATSILRYGNPVLVEILDECTPSGKTLDLYLKLRWDVWQHPIIGILGLFFFGIYSFKRISIEPRGYEEKEGFLPRFLTFVPSVVLLFINLSFLVITCLSIRDICICFISRDLVERNELFQNPYSLFLTIAFSFIILLYLFRSNGSCCKSSFCRKLGFFILLQIVIVILGQCIQTGSHVMASGFSSAEVLQFEIVIISLLGVFLLLWYIYNDVSFVKFVRSYLYWCVALTLLFSIQSPSGMAVILNDSYGSDKSGWQMVTNKDFANESLDPFVDFNYTYAHWYTSAAENPDESQELLKIANFITERCQRHSWRSWTLNAWRSQLAARKFLENQNK